MLAPLLLNLLVICSFLLIAGWAGDLINGWINTIHTGAPDSKRPATGRSVRINASLPFQDRAHASRKAVCRVQ